MDLSVEIPERYLNTTPIKGLDDLAYDVDVLLRHSPMSICVVAQLRNRADRRFPCKAAVL